MPTPQVRDVPEHIYRRLAELAERERRSLAQQTVAVLAKGLDVEVDPKARRRKVLEEAKQLQLGRGKSLPDFVKLIREDRER